MLGHQSEPSLSHHAAVSLKYAHPEYMTGSTPYQPSRNARCSVEYPRITLTEINTPPPYHQIPKLSPSSDQAPSFCRQSRRPLVLGFSHYCKLAIAWADMRRAALRMDPMTANSRQRDRDSCDLDLTAQDQAGCLRFPFDFNTSTFGAGSVYSRQDNYSIECHHSGRQEDALSELWRGAADLVASDVRRE